MLKLVQYDKYASSGRHKKPMKIFFTPGPSKIYPTVEKHMRKAFLEDILSISHRGTVFKKIFEETVASLKQLLNIPKEYHVVFLSSSLEAMERIIQSLVEKESSHFVNGAFSDKFYETSIVLGKKANKHNFNPEPIRFRVSSKPITRTPNSSELICFTQNETSNGTQIPLEKIYSFKKSHPKSIIAVDAVSSIPYADIDYKMIDVVFFSVQKGFGLPAGLSVVVLSPKAFEKAKKKENKGFHSLLNLVQNSSKSQTPETPNVLYLYLLNKVIKDMLKTGIEKIRKETEEKADLIYSFFEKNQNIFPLVQENEQRSKTVIVLKTKNDSNEIIEKLKRKNIIVGSGYGEFKNEHIRIANFPAHSLSDVKQLLKCFPKFL